MKKTYIAPAAQVVALEPLQMLAASIQVNTDGPSIDAADSYSAGRGWNSSDWTDAE